MSRTLPDGRRARGTARPRPVRVDAYGGVTYYDRPAVKHSPWDWRVGAYIFVGGLSGSSQVIATIARFRNRTRSRPLLRRARFVATAGSAIGAALLVADLKTPRRWYNMLRIFRPTSSMSIGSYILSAFGAASAVGALGEVLGGSGSSGRLVRTVADAAQVPAAVAGAGMSTYTASLLAATSNPLWAASSLPLAGHFAASAMAGGAAALSLGEQWSGSRETSDRLDDLALLATLADAIFTLAADSQARTRGVESAAEAPEPRLDATLVLGCALPLACRLLDHATGRRTRAFSVLGSLGILAGSFIAKSLVIGAGNRSADRPRDYFGFAQPRNLPEPGNRPSERTGAPR